LEDQTADMATGITPPLLFNEEKNTRSVYNLLGMPVPPDKKKGIVIENGRKVAYQ
jgi:hypothetical protein